MHKLYQNINGEMIVEKCIEKEMFFYTERYQSTFLILN